MGYLRVLMAISLAGGGVFAQKVSVLELKNRLFSVISSKKDGVEVQELKPSTGALQPGELNELQLTVKNNSKDMLTNLVVSQPLDRSQVYVSGSATKSPAINVFFSADGGDTFAIEPLKRVVNVQENGRSVRKEVVIKPEEYTTVRWTLKQLKASESQVLAIRFRVK